MKNILIFCQYFAPYNAVAAIRFTKAVKYMAKTGKYHFWIITKTLPKGGTPDELLMRDIQEVSEYVTVINIDMQKKLLNRLKMIMRSGSRGIENNAGEKKSTVSNDDIYYVIQKNYVTCTKKGIEGAVKRGIGKGILFANDLYDLFLEYLYAKKAWREVCELPVENADAIISSYGEIGSHLLALKYKKRYSQIKWIADYRDPIRSASELVRLNKLRLAEKAERLADYITGATAACKGTGKFPEKFTVITNGYDADDIRGFEADRDFDKFVISYTGNIYYNKSDMSELFHIISDLSKEGKLDTEKVSVVYAGKQIYLLEKQADKYGLSNIIDYRGLVSRKEALQIQYNSDILCALTWNNIDDDDILTGKFLEYFMMDKPVFAIVSGDKENSSMKQIVDAASLGYCLEEVNIAADYQMAKKWLLEKYQEYMVDGRVKCSSDKSVLERYSSKNMAQKFEKMIED